MSRPRATDRKQVVAETLREISHDVFDLVRWGSFVGITRFFWLDTEKLVFGALYWILSATLLGHMSAIFLLRTNIVIFSPARSIWNKALNLFVNLMICVVAFALTLWLVELMIIGISERYRI